MPLSDTRRRLLARLHLRKTREREELVLLEGVRVVREALEAGARPRFALISEGGGRAGPELYQLLGRVCPDLQTVTPDEMREAAGTDTPQGLLVVVAEPRVTPSSIWGADPRRILLLDGIQDPGNVGTLIRVAAAFACSGVVALDGTADVWSPRAVRAAAGTTFRLPVLHQSWADVRGVLDRGGTPLLYADAGGRDVAELASGPEEWVLAVGNEGEGCRPELRSLARSAVSIPMPGGVESLNVGTAGAVLLYELTRTRPPLQGPELEHRV